MKRRVTASDQPATWRSAIQGLIRRTGLLESEATPCGLAIPLSHAHAVLELKSSSDLTQSELAERLGLTKSGVSRLVAQLELAGHVFRRGDATDRRTRRLRLTAKGKRLSEKVDSMSLRRFSLLLEGIPRARRTATLKCLELLRKAALPSRRRPDT